jgi:hypothetical protein
MDLREFEGKAGKVAEIIQHVLVNELRLSAPMGYILTERNGLVWLLAVMDTLNLGRNIEVYADKKTVHHLSTALHGLYVGIANHTGLRFAVLLSRRPQLPKQVAYDGRFEQDVFRLGVDAMGRELQLSAGVLQNALIGAPPGGGKSNLLTLMAQTARVSGWKLYLADPQGHTFNPDIWNDLAAAPVAGNLEEVRGLLARVQAESLERQAKFRAEAVSGIPPEDLKAYNRLAAEPLPRFALIFDEVNTWLDYVLDEVTDLARQIRKFGGHIILAGHDWHGSDVPRSLSAQFYTRIGLASNDDTAARVVLNNAQWGKWLMGKPAGRAVIRANGYQAVQIYEVQTEMRQSWMSQASPAALSVLDEDEIRMVKAALELNAEFGIRAIVRLTGLGEWRVRKTAEIWELRGWLEKPSNATAARRVTEKLAVLAGFSLTGSQASQGLTGGSQASQGLSQALTGLSQGCAAAD